MNEIRKLINIETKIVETIGSTTTQADTTGVVVPLTQMEQGLDYINNRVGDSIKLQKIEIRYRMTINSSTTNTQVRVILFRDLDGYGTAPTIADVLQTVSILSPENFLKKDRFSILYDELVTLDAGGDSSAVGDIHIPHEGHVKYLGSTSAAASNGKGSVYFLVLSNETSVNSPFFAHHERVYFTDD